MFAVCAWTQIAVMSYIVILMSFTAIFPWIGYGQTYLLAFQVGDQVGDQAEDQGASFSSWDVGQSSSCVQVVVVLVTLVVGQGEPSPLEVWGLTLGVHHRGCRLCSAQEKWLMLGN